MRSPNRKVIEVIRDVGFQGPLPPYVGLGHRHLEKAHPVPVRTHGTHIVTYLIPVDLLAMVLPASVAKEIESVEFHYQTRGK
jgi:hypothetical protein